MKLANAPLVCLFALVGMAPASGNESSGTATEICRRSISHDPAITIQESFTDGEESYREYDGLRFGTTSRGQAFVQYADDAPIALEEIQFRDTDGKVVRLHSDSLALARSDLYVRDENKLKTYCLVIPFSGLGSSGSFQKFAALIAIGAQDGKATKPVGEVIKR